MVYLNLVLALIREGKRRYGISTGHTDGSGGESGNSERAWGGTPRVRLRPEARDGLALDWRPPPDNRGIFVRAGWRESEDPRLRVAPYAAAPPPSSSATIE